MNPNNAKVFILSVFIAFSITGCATSMKVTPLLGESDCHGMQLNGTIHYTKNIQYLPRTIKSDNGSDAEHSLDFHYEYQVTYGRDYLFNSGEMVPLFNPLTLIGAPIGADDVCIIGKLDILQKNEIVKSYKSVCLLEKTRNLFHQGETFSEMRKKGLLSVRDNIEKQMCQDKSFLFQFTVQE